MRTAQTGSIEFSIRSIPSDFETAVKPCVEYGKVYIRGCPDNYVTTTSVGDADAVKAPILKGSHKKLQHILECLIGEDSEFYRCMVSEQSDTKRGVLLSQESKFGNSLHQCYSLAEER